MPVWAPEIEKNGFFAWRATVARKPVVGRIDKASLDDFASWDTSFMWSEYPAHVDVLSVHGTADEVVPVCVLPLSPFHLLLAFFPLV